jgi:hypothetical protein
MQEVLCIYLFCQCSFWMKYVWLELESSVFKHHGVTHSRHQQQFSINVWSGILVDCWAGTQVLLHRLTGNRYQYFLLHDLPKLLEDVPLAIRAWMWYMCKGAVAQFSCVLLGVSQ